MESSEASGATTSTEPAPYGHACANCAQAKCRCILRTGADDCERCHRLQKQCRPSTAVRKSACRLRKPTATLATTSNGRVQEPEQRLDELASLARTVQPQPQEQTVDHATWPLFTSDSQSEYQRVLIKTPIQTFAIPGSTFLSPFLPPQSEGLGAAAVTATSHPLTGDLPEASEHLRTFRAHHLKFFPLVYIPATTTPQQLQQERPFLWLCIRAISTRSLEQQDELGRRIRETQCRQLLIEGERSIDLLLGLLAFLAW